MLPAAKGVRALVHVVCLLFVAACAVGVTSSDDNAPSTSTQDGSGGNGSAQSNSSTTSSSASGNGGNESVGAGGQGGSGGQGEGGGEGGSMPGCNYDSPNMCSSAENLGSLAGDKKSAAKTTSASTSKWIRIRITEEVSSIFEEDLSYTVTLTNPPNMNFDLFVHEGPQDGKPDCNASAKKGSPAGNSQTVSAKWDDDQGLGGEDDSVWLSIEVRYISGMECNAAATWTLSIQGHT